MSVKLSVIIPVYNVEKYLQATLDSVINQTLQDIEIICVDDGSTDSSPKILSEYAAHDSRIRIITQENAGQSSARNKGLAVANAELIAFMDSDDILSPDAYATAVSKMTDDIDYVCFGIQVVGNTLKHIQKTDNEYYHIKFRGKKHVNNNIIRKTDVSPFWVPFSSDTGAEREASISISAICFVASVLCFIMFICNCCIATIYELIAPNEFIIHSPLSLIYYIT